MTKLLHGNPVVTEPRVRGSRYLTACFVALVLGLMLAFAVAALQSEAADAQVGPSGVSCNASGGSGGLTPGENNVSIAGRPALVYVGSGYRASEPTMLTFYLHGDGAGDQTFMAQSRRDLLDDNGWIYVAPRARGDVWYSNGVSGSPAGNTGIEANGQLLEDVFEALFDDYNVCRNVLLGSSASGGSWFYDGYFLPTRGDRYPAYMNVGCGSSGIDDGWSAFPFYGNLLTFNTNQDILARTKMHYSIGTADFLYEDAQKAIPHLQSLGFDVTTDFRAGVTHCAFDVDETAVNWWTDLCKNGFVPVTSRDASGAVRSESCNAGQVVGLSCGGLTVTVDLGAGQTPTASADVIWGTNGPDIVDGLGGDDVICGRGGNDELRGGAGNDTLLGDAGNDTLVGGGGDDLIRGGPDDDNISGGVGNDRLLGGTGGDTIAGGDGNDFIGGFGGDDIITGGPGNETIFGGFGKDTIDGGPGNDNIRGLIGDDTIHGGDGDDKIFGDRGNDQLFGDAGNDTVEGGNAEDKVNGNGGDDALAGGKRDDVLNGGPGTDICVGNAHLVADTAIACETQFGIP